MESVKCEFGSDCKAFLVAMSRSKMSRLYQLHWHLWLYEVSHYRLEYDVFPVLLAWRNDLLNCILYFSFPPLSKEHKEKNK